MRKIIGVTINYNSEEETVACLDSLAKLNLSEIDFSFIIVDNASTQKSQQIVEAHVRDREYPFPINLIKNNINTGFSGGNNIGIKKALEENADFILLINNDTSIDSQILHALSNRLEERKIGIVSPKIYFYKGCEFHKDRYSNGELGNVIWYAGGKLDWNNVYGTHRGVDEVDTGQFDISEQTEFATGCCMLIKKEVFEKIGYFDEAYFLYYEDIDFCMRAREHGFEIWYEPSGNMWHKNAGSTGGSGSELQDYFMSRNRLFFGFRYAPLRTKIALFKEAGRNMISGRRWQKKGIQDYFLHRFGKGSYTP